MVYLIFFRLTASSVCNRFHKKFGPFSGNRVTYHSLSAHTQTIEGFWQKAKNPFKNMHGQTNDKIPIYLDEVVFRWNNKGKDMFKLMISLISKHYNPNSHLPAEGIPNDIVY